MKKFISFGLSFLFAGTLLAQENPREIFWENALSVIREKPRDAIAAFDEIAGQAEQAAAWDEYALALCLRAATRAQIEEGRNESVTAVRELQRAVAEAPSVEARAFLSSVLACTLRDLSNERRFRQMRPQTPLADNEGKDDDLAIWSNDRLAAAALAAYQNVFEDAETLKKIPIAMFAAKQTSNRKILKAAGFEHYDHAGNGARLPRLRSEFGLFSLNDSPAADFPTLYDFFAQDAVKFYPNLSRRAPEAEKAQRELLAAWKEFHANDADKSAYARAVFAGFSPESESYEADLKNFTKEFSYYPIAAEAFAALAQNAIEDERREEAFLFAKEGYEKYRQHKNSAGCAAILNDLLSKNIANINTESVWFDAESAQIAVSAKNVEKLHFRAVPWDWQDFLRRERNRPENLSAKESKEILFSEEGAVTWSHELEKFTDFATHEFSVPVPYEKLEPGFYFITASADPDFKSFAKDRVLPYMTVWVSDIAVITEPVPYRENAKEARTLRGYVVNAKTGEPLENVEIAAWNKVYGGDRVPVESVKSAADGSFELPGLKQDFVALAVAPDGNAVSISETTRWRTSENKPDNDIGKLFTDRAIYRPGQLIHFKGIRARYDADKPGSGKVLPGEKVEVKLYDANDKEVAKSECYTNAFGSFAGAFTAPTGLLKGIFTLKFDKVEKEIRIEEYKRPKFELTLEAPEKQIILGQTAEMLVSAKAFTGMPLADAKITWTVTENSYEDYSFEEKVIARGDANLDADGKFKISFPTEPAKLFTRRDNNLSPTEKLKAERRLSRNYVVDVAVTDSTGETHTQSEYTKIGNCGVKAYLNADDKGFRIEVMTLSGKPVAVPATLCVYEAVLPEKIRRYPNAHPYLWNEDIPRGKKFFEKQFTSDAKSGVTHISVPDNTLPESGAFIAVISVKDAFSRPFEESIRLEKIGGTATQCPVKLPIILSWESVSQYTQVGETFSFVWGSGYESARARIEIAKNGKTLKTFWTQKGNTQETISIPVTRELIGGFNVRLAQFRNGRLEQQRFLVSVPEPEKDLKIEWQRFRSQLIPGGAEVWTARITLPDGTPANAEMLALLYDRSLDSLCSDWQDTGAFNLTSYDSRNWLPELYPCNVNLSRIYSSEQFPKTPYAGKATFRPVSWILPRVQAGGMMKRSLALGADRIAPVALQGAPEPENFYAGARDYYAYGEEEEDADEGVPTHHKWKIHPPSQKEPPATPRKNLQETAFFQPFINTDANGVAQITFVVPEALTGWRFIAFAHDKALRSGSLEEKSIFTSKPLMAQPNAPRFLREGDTIEFPVKISNSGKTPLKGTAQLAFNRADDGKDVFGELCGEAREQSFNIPAGSSKTLTWEIRVPENCGFLTCRATARAGEFSDGEEALLPVLPRKISVSESANFLVRAGTEREAALDLKNKKIEQLSIEINADPAWDAFLALPRLALLARENDSSDSIFYRFYTNKLAEKIAKENPDYRRKFDALTALGNDAQDLRSPLAQDTAKNIALEATPFVMDADDETAQRRAVAQLFDGNTMAQESARALAVLRERLDELNGNGWSWFPGAQNVSPRITRTILIGLARLVEIGALDKSEIQFARSAIRAQDAWAASKFNRFDEKGLRSPDALSTELVDWLYLRALTIDENFPSPAWQHYIEEASKPEVWTKLPRYSQAQIAIVLYTKDDPMAERIVESIRQHAVRSEELGMYWKDGYSLCPWCIEFASIETQAMMIELFAKVANDAEAVAELKTWLLTQKQAQAWRAFRATAEAVFALLRTNVPNAKAGDDAGTLTEDAMRGNATTAAESVAEPKVFAGTQRIAGDGKRFTSGEIVPALETLKMKNPGKNPIFVSAVWNYEADIDSIENYTPSNGFKIRKSLWKKAPGDDGKARLYPIRAEMLQPGDEIVVRLVIEADRDFEFVHVKDLRASGCEPTGTRSGYRRNNAVWYYTTSSDTAEEFFFDRLPQGKHVLEYSIRAVHSGKYSAGHAEIRSLYAPEFSAHSKAATLQTR